MTTNIIFDVAKTIHGLNRDENFSYSITLDPTILPAVVDETNVTGDATWLFNQSEATLDNRVINITPSSLGGNYGYLMLQGEPEVIVDSAGNVISVQEKYAIANSGKSIEVIISSSVAGAKRYESTISAPQNYTVDYEFQSFAAGSLGQHLTDQMLAMIIGHTSNTDAAQIYWATHDPSDLDNPIATLNPTRFCSEVDLSGFSVMRTGLIDDRYPVSLISDRHVIGSEHTGISVGDKIVFQKNNGVFVSALVSALDLTSVNDDTFIALLDTVVADANLIPFKLMGQHWEYTYAPALHGIPQNVNAKITAMPTLTKRMHNRSGAWESWISINGTTSNTASLDLANPGTMSISQLTVPSGLALWSNEIIPGDSGSPNFFMINGEPILISHNSAVGGSDSFSNSVSEINAAMNALSGVAQGTYAVEHPDLSEFISYI